MSRIAFVFPGQGSQTVGMGKDLYDEFEILTFLKNIAEKFEILCHEKI